MAPLARTWEFGGKYRSGAPLAESGNIFCVLTGREPLSAIKVLDQFGGVYDYLLACSGAVQMDAQNEFSTWKNSRPTCCRKLPLTR